MSGHLIGCVKRLKGLPKGHKLGLVAFADSADDRTHIGFPGYEGVQEWADVGRSQAANIIADLTEWGFLRQHKRGHRGQRAEYVVFPNGCCDQHRAPVEEPEVDVETLAAAAGVDVEAARLMLSAMGTTLPAKGSSPTGPSDGGKGPARPDPNDVEPRSGGLEGAGKGPKGPESVRGSRSPGGAFTTSTTPPTPTSGGAEIAASCPRHPTGRPNCRACGTTPRQLAAEAAKRKAAERRAQEAAKTAADRRAREEAAKPPSELLDVVRAQIDHTRTQRKA